MSHRVEKWIGYDEAKSLPESTGGLGGWFGFRDQGQRWSDYIDTVVDPTYLEALRTEIIARNLREGGFWHQQDAHGVPVFEDGTVGLFSMRAWGDLLAAIWSTEDDHDYCYVDFAWDT